MPQEDNKRFLTPLAHVLTEYLQIHTMKQVDLAEKLNWGERTLRRYKNGEDVLTDIRELKRVADILEVPPERLGILAHSVPFTPDQIEPTITHIWKLIKAAKYYEANMLVDKLVREVTGFIHNEDPALLRQLADVQHVAGYVKSQVSRANETASALSHYHEMEKIARILRDQTLLNIALTYEGDMLQRGGNVEESITYLEAARDTTPQADMSARGNGIQLLGRAYFKAQRLADFDRAIKEAEALAYEPEVIAVASSTKGQYSAGTVYEEYGRSLGLLGKTSEAMAYLDKAEKLFAQDWNVQRREILLSTARAMVLVRGKEIQKGAELAAEAAKLCKESGNIRLLERLYGVQQYLDRLAQEIGNAGSLLKDALLGPVEY